MRGYPIRTQAKEQIDAIILFMEFNVVHASMPEHYQTKVRNAIYEKKVTYTTYVFGDKTATQVLEDKRSERI